MPDYRVQLDSFSGPMDLLLYLVRRNEVDIVRLPIARITNQFLQFLDVLQLLDLDLIGDFVVLASSLIEIKSRQVLPRAEEDDAPDEIPLAEDPCSELIQQLLEYKKYKDAAVALEERNRQWQLRFARRTNDLDEGPRDPADQPIHEVELWDLVSAFSRVMREKAKPTVSSIRYDETPISVYIDRIGARVRASGRVPFSDFFDGSNMRSKIVGIFLAILELLRHHGFRAEQVLEYGEIYVLPPARPEEAVASSEDSSEAERIPAEPSNEAATTLASESSLAGKDDETP